MISRTDRGDVPVRRVLSAPGFVVVLAAVVGSYFASAWLLEQISGLDAGYDDFPDARTVLTVVALPYLVSASVVVAVITALRWWPPVVREHLRARRWVWAVSAGPVVVALLVATDIGNVTSSGVALTLAVALVAVLVGIVEELTFRGVAIEFLRSRGVAELAVAGWSSLLFGLFHLTNAPENGLLPSVVQVVVTTGSGFLFYLGRRVSGGIAWPIAAHAVWDFALFTGTMGGASTSSTSRWAVVGLVEVVAVVVAVVRRSRIDASPQTAA